MTISRSRPLRGEIRVGGWRDGSVVKNLQRTQVWFPILTMGDPQFPLTPAPEDPIPSSVRCWHLLSYAQTHTEIHTYAHDLKQLIKEWLGRDVRIERRRA